MAFRELIGTLVLTMTVWGCGGSNDDGTAQKPGKPDSLPATPAVSEVPTSDEVSPMTGVFMSLAGEQENLLQYKDKTTVVFFASDTCQVCAQEAEIFRDEINSRGGIPSNVDLLTIVVGAFAEDAADWKDIYDVPWKVGFQAPEENASLLRQYCPAVQTPCTVVYRPDQGVIFAKNGEVSPAQIQALTGDWL